MELKGKVVVVTGGSSGLGRATALAFARCGAIVIVAARRVNALQETVRLCAEQGGTAYAIVADVGDESAVRRVADFALAQGGGRIDVWINNAGVTAFGALELDDFSDHRRVIEINLFGAIYGARAVLPVFLRQRAGVLINVGSVLSKIGQPFVPSYVISKFAIDGLTEALRAEVAAEPDIHICSLYPYAMSTPHFESGANHAGKRPHAMPPTESPETVAQALVALVLRPRRNRYVPRTAVIALAMHALAPRTVERLVHDALTRWHFDPVAEPHTSGALYAASADPGAVAGTRAPLLSTQRLLLWTFVHLGVLALGGTARWLGRRLAT